MIFCGGEHSLKISLALIVCDSSYLEDREEKAHGLTESISDRGVYRTASATTGLLKSCKVDIEEEKKYLQLMNKC